MNELDKDLDKIKYSTNIPGLEVEQNHLSEVMQSVIMIRAMMETQLKYQARMEKRRTLMNYLFKSEQQIYNEMLDDAIKNAERIMGEFRMYVKS